MIDRAITFINPPYRRRLGSLRRRRITRSSNGRFTANRSFSRRHTHMARATRRRRATVRRNPPKMTAALKAKISRAVKAANRRRGNRPRRASRRRATMALAPRRRRSITRVRTLTRYHSRGVARRRSSFRRRRSGGGSILSGGFGIKSLFSQRTLMVAGGAVGAGLLTTFVVNRFSSSLPGAASPIGSIAYKLLIPWAGAYVVKRFDARLAEGMIIGGAVLAINQLINTYAPQVNTMIAGTSAYLGNGSRFRGLPGAYVPQRRGTGAYLHGMPNMNASYDANSAFGASVYDSEPAFPSSAW